MSININGPYAILTTPFKKDGGVNIDALLETVDGLCGTSISGIIPCGSTAEFTSTSFEQNTFTLKAIAGTVSKRKQLIGGATSPDASVALKYMDFMGNLGYTAAMVAPPYYYKYSDAEIAAFYRELGAAQFPVMAYNIPAFTSPISLGVFRQLLGMKHVAAMKNSSANIKEIMHQIQIKMEERPGFYILTGTDDAIVPCVTCGCAGSSTALCSLLPNTICGIYDALNRHDLPAALELQHKIQPIIRIADSFPFPQGYKLISLAMGHTIGPAKHSIPKTLQEDFYPAVQKLYRLLSELGTEIMPGETPGPVEVQRDLCL
jgi:dihydrodipicolinate synthase/N-acetylneuraminate lyase